jgi:hypothetical protein
MDMFDRLRFAYLRDQLVRARSEKLALGRTIHSPSTLPTRKQSATRRYCAVNAELRNIVGGMEECIAATKQP